jgi:archaellum component FlaC
MTKEEITEELDRIKWQIKELSSEYNMLAEMLFEIEEQEQKDD